MPKIIPFSEMEKNGKAFDPVDLDADKLGEKDPVLEEIDLSGQVLGLLHHYENLRESGGISRVVNRAIRETIGARPSDIPAVKSLIDKFVSSLLNYSAAVDRYLSLCVDILNAARSRFGLSKPFVLAKEKSRLIELRKKVSQEAQNLASIVEETKAQNASWANLMIETLDSFLTASHESVGGRKDPGDVIAAFFTLDVGEILGIKELTPLADDFIRPQFLKSSSKICVNLQDPVVITAFKSFIKQSYSEQSFLEYVNKFLKKVSSIQESDPLIFSSKVNEILYSSENVLHRDLLLRFLRTFAEEYNDKL